MAHNAVEKVHTLRTRVSEDEWQTRVDLAALYRLVALAGWTDLIFTHISAAVSGTDDRFLINAYGMAFDEITASSLVMIDGSGNVVGDVAADVNKAGFAIHSAVHGARPDARFVMHLHADYGVAVSCQKDGLLPLSQHSLIALPEVAYHTYEGAAELDERQRLAADLGSRNLMILRNHGTLSIGETASACWLGMHYLEMACKHQVLALSAGRYNILIAPDAGARQIAAAVVANGGIKQISAAVWPSLLRRLKRLADGYDR